MKILDKKDPKIPPCGTPKNISLHELYMSFIFTLHFLFERSLCINFKELLSKSYASILAIESSLGTQSKVFDRPISHAPTPKAPALSTLFFHFLIIVIKQFWVLQPIQNPYCFLDNRETEKG